ncbi:MAG: DUF4328 domain-containing protein [Polyangiaceae bacterium]
MSAPETDNVYQAPGAEAALPVESERPMRLLVLALDVCLAVGSGTQLGLLLALYVYGDGSIWSLPAWCFQLGQVGGYAFYVGCFLFLVFVYRAHRNARALGVRRLRVSSQRAVVWFLVPVLNAYFGYAVMRELWKYSDKPYKPSKLVLAWWLACLFDWTLVCLAAFMLTGYEPGEVLANGVRVVSAPSFALAAFLTSRVVHGIQARQAARARRLAD